MVSRLPHCMMDLLSRHHVGELDGDVVGVVSNHPDLESLVRPFEVPFNVIPVAKDRKAGVRSRTLEASDELRADTVVLARYMQVLSGEFLRAWSKPIINIHHSFLPAFAGQRPHKQAHDRGVKLIGATAHYVTEELDAGPIIAQATAADDPSRHRRRPRAQGQRPGSDGPGKSGASPPQKAGTPTSQPHNSLRITVTSLSFWPRRESRQRSPSGAAGRGALGRSGCHMMRLSRPSKKTQSTDSQTK